MAQDVPWERLFEAATAARDRAFAPYSNFPVGAAVWTDDGAVHPGANVENSSYGLSICAERNAIGRAVVEGARRVLAVAIVTNAKSPCPPCGMCRQVIAEFGDPQTPVRSRSPDGSEARYTLADLLPHAFTRDFL
jgi:cytidine deaminase